ncbi:hypothetical protein Tco_0310343 [Tanacetum coccineum]
MKMESSSPGGGTYAVFSKFGFCTFSVDVFEFCSGSFLGIETSDVGTRGVEGSSKVLSLLVEPDMVKFDKLVVDWLVVEKLDLDGFDGFDFHDFDSN